MAFYCFSTSFIEAHYLHTTAAAVPLPAVLTSTPPLQPQDPVQHLSRRGMIVDAVQVRTPSLYGTAGHAPHNDILKTVEARLLTNRQKNRTYYLLSGQRINK